MAERPQEPIRIVVPLPFALRSANAWLFAGRGATPSALVDSGIGTPAGREALRQGLSEAGGKTQGMRLFLTHGHVDHAGNAGFLGRDRGAVLAAPAAESPYVETFRKDAAQRYEAYTAALHAHGVPTDEIARMRARGEHMDPWTEDTPIQDLLQDGQRVMLGQTAAAAHFAPGHTAGSVVYATEGNDLLTGDTLLQHITSNAIEVTDADRGRYAQYLRTLDALRRFVGMRALPGHHEPFSITDALLDGHLAKHAERSRRILDRLDRPRTAWELVPEVFPRLVHDQSFLGVCEVVGHLHALEIEGAVAVRGSGGVRRFVRA